MKQGQIHPAGDLVMPNQELERDHLFRVLAIQRGLLDATRIEQLGPGWIRLMVTICAERRTSDGT